MRRSLCAISPRKPDSLRGKLWLQSRLPLLPEPRNFYLSILEELLPYIDAMNIDLKGFSSAYYRRLGGDLETVLAFIRRAAKDCHVELTTLIVPGENDSEEEMEQEAQWIASIDPKIPLHVTRFFPRYRMQDREATDVERILRLKAIAGRHLAYVCKGNC